MGITEHPLHASGFVEILGKVLSDSLTESVRFVGLFFLMLSQAVV